MLLKGYYPPNLRDDDVAGVRLQRPWESYDAIEYTSQVAAWITTLNFGFALNSQIC